MESYIAGFVDGDGSIYITKLARGFQLMVDICQCNAQLLGILNTYFSSKGSIYLDSRAEKYLTESASKLRFCGKETIPILELMRERGIVKAEQAKLALQFVPLIKRHNCTTQKDDICVQMAALNKDKSTYVKPYDRLCNAYISGLYDAEGCVSYQQVKGTKMKFYIKITQKSDPRLLKEIQAFLGYGKVPASEAHNLKFENYAAIRKLHDVVKDFSRIKLAKHVRLIAALDSPEYNSRPKRTIL